MAVNAALAELAAKGCPECGGSGSVRSEWNPFVKSICPTCRHTIAVAEAWGEQRCSETLDAACRAINLYQDIIGWQPGESRNALVSEIRADVDRLRHRQETT
jgi:hypothetical protein